MNLHRLISVYLLLTFLPGICMAKQMQQQVPDKFLRTYISPTRIVWQSDSTGNFIKNAPKLLEAGNGQADLVTQDLCILKNSDTENSAILLDFGREIHGGIQLVTGMHSVNAPVKVRITLGESVSEAMSSVASTSATNDHAIREFEIILPWLGSIEVGNSGFRFARIELLEPHKELKLKEMRAIAINRDILWKGSFKSSDELLNKIWQTGAYTVYLNMQNYLWDGIKRDRLVWVGDMHPEIMTILAVFGYNEVVPKSLDLIRDITKLPEYMNGISSYSMWWIQIQYQWFLNNGDLKYLESNKDYIFATLELLKSKIDTNGIEKLDGMRFLDWPTTPNEKAVHAGLQALMLNTFYSGQKIALALGNKQKAQEYTETIKLLKSHIPDPNNSKASAAMLALSGLANATDINNQYLSNNPTNDLSTFYGYYILQAKAMANDYEGAFDIIRKYWGGMISLGATTFWEDFDINWLNNAARIDQITLPGKTDVHSTYGNYCYKGLRNSLCHGWASGPTAWLSEYVLGITIVEPGCKTIKIAPHLNDLDWVEGTYPTPMGMLYVRHEKTKNNSIKTTIKAPRGIKII